MAGRHWNRIGAVVVALALLLVINPEVRLLVLLVNALGVDLFALLLVLQIGALLPGLAPLLARGRRSFCGACCGVLRCLLRTFGIMLPPGQGTLGLRVLLFVRAQTVCCPGGAAGMR